MKKFLVVVMILVSILMLSCKPLNATQTVKITNDTSQSVNVYEVKNLKIFLFTLEPSHSDNLTYGETYAISNNSLEKRFTAKTDLVVSELLGAPSE